jgi:hypothetical protein
MSTPSAKAPYVPFYDDSTPRRHAREAPTAVFARPKSKAPPRRSSTARAIALFALVCAVGTIAVLSIRSKTRHLTPPPKSPPTAAPPEPTAPATASVFPPVTVSATASATASARAPAMPDTTILSIDTVPTHATVSLNGRKLGSSPIELTVPKSNDAAIVEIQYPGYVVLKERVVPDMNQRLKLNLIPAKTIAKPSPSVPYRKFE